MILFYINKLWRKISSSISSKWNHIVTWLIFKGNRVSFSSFRTGGIPYVMVAMGAKGITIGKNFAMNNGIRHNPIGCPQPCTLFVDREASIEIGDNVGISQATLISHCSIKIGNNVKIGGGGCVFTSDFHSLDPIIRAGSEDQANKKCAPVVLCDNVFIGAHSIILKGVTVGENSIVGAGSVVTKNIPANQIWGGNPAKFIRNL